MNNKDTVEAPELRTENPFEQQIEVALIRAGESYTTDHDGSNASHLDFCLTNRDINIEVKTMHSDRVAEQMSRVSDVIVAQGQRAIAYLASLIARVDPPAAPRRVSEMVEKKTADVRHKPETVDELVEYLFTNGSRHRGQRLILVDEDYSGSAQVTKASNLGGWSRLAIRDVIKDFMERQ